MSRVIRTTLAMLLLFVLFALPTDQAYACSCMMPAPPLEAMANSDAVFAGKVVRIDTQEGAITSSADPIKITFEVSRVWKGEQNSAIALATARDSASCGYPFMVGEEYLVYANSSETGLTTGLCSRTMPLSTAGEDLDALGEGIVPLTAEQSGFSPALWGVAVGAVLLGLALLGMMVLRKPGAASLP